MAGPTTRTAPLEPARPEEKAASADGAGVTPGEVPGAAVDVVEDEEVGGDEDGDASGDDGSGSSSGDEEDENWGELD